MKLIQIRATLFHILSYPCPLPQIPTMIGNNIALFGMLIGVGELLGSMILG